MALSATGRLLRDVARAFGKKMTADALLVLLKHPLVASAADRGPHLKLTRDLELRLRKYGPPFPEPDALRIWADSRKDETARPWVEWIIATLAGLDTLGPRPLADRLRMMRPLADDPHAGVREWDYLFHFRKDGKKVLAP